MKVKVFLASNRRTTEDKASIKEGIYIINSLEELIGLQKTCKHPIIIDTYCDGDEDFRIEIYNDYRE